MLNVLKKTGKVSNFLVLNFPFCHAFFNLNLVIDMRILLVIIGVIFNLAVCYGGSPSIDSLKLSIITENPFSDQGGYYISHSSTPVSKHEYIFVANPLKKGFIIIDGQKIFINHTITLRERKGLTMYFSSDEYNARLTLKNEVKDSVAEITYSGILTIQSGINDRKFKVHGRIIP